MVGDQKVYNPRGMVTSPFEVCPYLVNNREFSYGIIWIKHRRQVNDRKIIK